MILIDNKEVITIETITKRKSVRSYEQYKLSEEESGKISTAIKEPATISTAIEWSLNLNSPMGSACIFGELSEKNDSNLVEYGFQGEQLLVKLTTMGYGTCWLARSPNKAVPAIIAFGKIKEGGVKGKFIKFFAGSDKRKELIELLKGNPHSLSIEMASILESCRWAPSAVNRQPWLFEVTENEERLIIYSKSPLDLGIVLANGYMAALNFFKNVKVVKIDKESYAIEFSNKKGE